jgi:hypothetical protein
MKDVLVALAIFVVFSVLCFGCYSLFKEQRDCQARGGAFVKTFMGYTCVGGR